MDHVFKITLLILFLSSISHATADGPDHFNVRGVASNDVLWIHPTPNYKSKKIGKIPYNAKCLKNLGYKGQWCKVNYQGTIGWVNGKFLREGGNCLQNSYSNSHYKEPKSSHIEFTKQLLQGKVLQTQMYGSDLIVKFLPPRFQSSDGDILFHFNTNVEEENEILSYKLIDGKIIYYGNDGSKYRMTLHSASPMSWVILEETDIDGDDKQFEFGEVIKTIYSVKKSEILKKSDDTILSTSSSDKIDQLMMQIYGRMDTRIASRREHIQSINDFLHTASLMLIKKHKLDIQMQEFRRHQMAAVGAPPKVTALINALEALEKLDWKTIVDHNSNKITTMTKLKDTYVKAAKESMQMQRDNYISESTRESDFSKLEKLIIRSGSPEERKDMKKSEIMRLKGEYKYYKNILDNASIWCLADRDVSQKKPLFYPKTSIIELLYEKYEAELYRSGKSYDAKDLLERVKKIEAKSKTRKHQFNQDYLYDIRTKPDRLLKRF